MSDWNGPVAESLERLCAQLGIATSYHDIWGVRHAVAPDGLAALVAEFGFDATPQGLEAGLRAQSAAAWQETLPPVLVVEEGATRWSVRLRLPRTTRSIDWSLQQEDGRVHRGRADFGALVGSTGGGPGGGELEERRIELELPLAAGYHRLSIDGAGEPCLVICAPSRCYKPELLQGGGKAWGPAVQLYALRSKRNWGIGDFTDLAQLTEHAARQGAGLIGLNPLHAMFAHNPAHASPYSPSSRQQLNVLYIDVESVEEFRDCVAARHKVQSAEFQVRLAAQREQPLVDYPGVAALKFDILAMLHAHFREHHLEVDGRSARDEHGRAFLAFVAERGEPLRRHALFEALQESFHSADPSVWGWPVWPEAYREPDSDAVRTFEREHGPRVQYHQYLQWLAYLQLQRVSDRCRELGLAIGLYIDLAVSVDRAGSDVWGHQDVFATGATVGAPPDEFNPNGQGWGLPPLRPDRLRATRYRFFIDTVRAAMRGAGALRIDHVMGLMRLFWIPPGRTAHEGAYVHYALDEMMAIVALESRRNRCMVIGEDLGTVADEMRAMLDRFQVLSYRLAYFEQQAGGFKPPEAYPRNALAAISTHDLATLQGWWAGHDLRLRLELDLFPDRAIFEKQLVDRAQERIRLLLAAQHAGLLDPAVVARASGAAVLPPEVVEALHAFVAATPCELMVVQLEDVLGVVDQINMPGTTDAQPNWRRKLPLDLQAIAADETVSRIARRLAAMRPHPQLASVGTPHTSVPRATYRLQFHKDFTFDHAIAVLPYLAELGVSHVYCSPIQRARPGSMHGYDVVAHDEVNPELGGREGFERFSAALRSHGMGQLLDMVPNHMGVLGADNAWWMDVLENGPASLYAQHFDIDWQPLNPELSGKVLLPVLGDHYGDILARGELVITFDASAGSLSICYHDHRFPLAPRTYRGVLAAAAERVADPDVAAGLASIAAAFDHLPGRDQTEGEAPIERARDKELLKSRLARLVSRQPAVAEVMAAAVAELNLPAGNDALHELVEAQAYRLSYWRVAADEINYRRFFDINELAALRMERDEVFEATQAFALDLAAAGHVDGLRIDHPDGLYDPARYFQALQEGYARRAGFVLPALDADGRPPRPLYVVAEKIAAPHEEVPTSWHVHGTTGYRFANVANGVLVDAQADERFNRIWRSFTGVTQDFETLSRIGKRDIMRTALGSELMVLSTELLRIARADRRTRDYTLNALRRALSETVACLPVYRTYIIDRPSEQDEHYVELATRHACEHSDEADISVFAFLRRTLLGQAVENAAPALAERVRRFAIRFQQFSAPVAAKGVEDTAFYRYFPLSSLNEVGGEPAFFGLSVAGFHEASADRAARWPHTMLATSTHDNKRSEDVRNRIDVLSEIPATWRLALRRWRSMNAAVREASQGGPSAADEYLLYQTLLGTLPPEGLSSAERESYVDRIVVYMLKAARESKVHTRWTHPQHDYEQALEGFVRGILASVDENPFLDDLQALSATLAHCGALNSLSLVLLKYGSPGVPDLYQGNELMDLSLVDPDNRRPVDYELRARRLEELKRSATGTGLAALVQTLAAAPYDGRAKLWLTWRLLSWRREQPALFRDGDYVGLAVEGERASHVIAFQRRHGEQAIVVVAARLFASLASQLPASAEEAEAAVARPSGPVSEPSVQSPAPTHGLPVGAAVWGDTMVLLPDWPTGTRLRNVLTDEVWTSNGGGLPMAQLFARFPAAALEPLAD
ncbi:MAG: malto-oligosyltrehalose synthase [Comamonadaceae bacterium]|nr:MAG: malto-oligosyltrehalose synthase [Comamonadaceae bacterium]